MSEQNFEHIIGPSAKFSEHKTGDEIRFCQDGRESTGTIIYVRAPGPTAIEGKSMIYVVDCGEGFPSMVFPGEVIEEEEKSSGSAETA